jgi:hypothetical protein
MVTQWSSEAVAELGPTLTSSLPCTVPSESKVDRRRMSLSLSGRTPLGLVRWLPSPHPHMVLSSLVKPDGHSVHAVAPVAPLALPASHCNEELGERHFGFALASPPPHLTCSQLAAPTVLMYDAGAQGVQAATPVVPLNLPATHSSHASPGGRKVHDTPTSYSCTPYTSFV